MTPLTHHDILRWVEPFTRGGRRVDLAASERMERRIAFKPIQRAGELLETLQLEVSEAGRFKLTRRLARADGLQAQVQAEGQQAGELLARIEAVAPQRQFISGEGFVIALSHDVPAEPEDGAALVLTRAEARFAGLGLTMRVPALHGIPAEIELLTPGAGGPGLDLPDDLLAVLGWRWPLLNRFTDGWRGSLRLRGRGAERSQDAEARLAQAAQHLALTLAEPPGRFHARQRAARWRVVGRRSLPLLACVALLGGALAVPSLGLADNSVFRMLIFHAPPLLLVAVFCLHEMPRIEIPPWPRPATAGAWWPPKTLRATETGR
jgi:hypothetical protein